MPPEPRFVPRFAAEPPQEGEPYGRWAHRLRDVFLAACDDVDGEGEEIGEPGEPVFYPDRNYGGRTYIPMTASTSTGLELFGAVSFPAGQDSDLLATADVTAETAAANPDWRLDLCDEVIGAWRGEEGRTAAMTLVWGTALVGGGAIATAELADLAVDQCITRDARFTLIAPDAYRSDLLEIKLFDRGGAELARESLYDEDGDGDGEDDGEPA